ncbi:MAG: hypothetical protein R3249_09155 [Nitriliruptorales bacterium]|nr:hypothetical protein [Nitriliruptorales bacterium]
MAAAAIPVLRAWIGRADELSIEGIDARGYGVLEHAVVEAIDHPGQGAAVASVLAVVASFDDGTRQVLRVAVPLIVLNREVRPAGDPWLLPPPTLSVAAVRSTPLAGADSALIDAVGLQLAELYGEVAEIHGLHVGELWPLVVDATIRDPLDGKLRRQQIWLRADGQRLPIAGWFAVPPGRAGSDPGASDTAAPRAEEDGDPDMATDEPAPS